MPGSQGFFWKAQGIKSPVELMKEHVFLRACTPDGFPFARSETSRKRFEEFVRRILGAGIMCHHIHTHQTHGLGDDDNIITMVAHIEVEIWEEVEVLVLHIVYLSASLVK